MAQLITDVSVLAEKVAGHEKTLDNLVPRVETLEKCHAASEERSKGVAEDLKEIKEAMKDKSKLTAGLIVSLIAGFVSAVVAYFIGKMP
jgi:iron-sulfur cluster repair protein YtfE (RIC family)